MVSGAECAYSEPIMKKWIGLFLLLVLSSPVFAGNERLIGTWKSNKEGTLDYLRIHTMMTSRQLDAAAQLLGKMSLTFDQTNLTATMGTWKAASQYKVISETKNSITIEIKDPGTGKTASDVLEFSAGSLWTSDDRFHGYKERFDRVK